MSTHPTSLSRGSATSATDPVEYLLANVAGFDEASMRTILHDDAVAHLPARLAAMALIPTDPSRRRRPSTGPLAGVRITDFCWMGVGALATRILADFGAEVVRIEDRNRLDMPRRLPLYKDGPVRGYGEEDVNPDPNKSGISRPFPEWARGLGRPDEIVGTCAGSGLNVSSFPNGSVLTVDDGVSVASPLLADQ